MAKVILTFSPPDDPTTVALNIYESPISTGPFNKIERTTDIGVAPDFISQYTTIEAALVDDWFAIEWENAAGVLTDLSQPVQGGTETAVGVLVERVMQRDPALDERVVQQEAEAAIEMITGGGDPYDTTLSFTYRQLNGLTYLVLARSYMVVSVISSTSGNKWVAGIVSLDATVSSAKSPAAIESLIKEANRLLGINYSVILLLKEIQVAGGYKQLAGVDLSRLIFELQ